MYVCLCKGITDRDIKHAVSQGANSFREVRDQLGVSTQCGKCAKLARAIVAETLPATPALPGNSPGLELPFYNAMSALA